MASGTTLPAVFRGDTWPGLTMTIQTADTDGIVTGPLDLTGASVKMQVRVWPTDTNPAIEWSTAFGATNPVDVTDPANGEITVPPTVISLSPGVYYYDIQITRADGIVMTPLYGTWQVLVDVTR